MARRLPPPAAGMCRKQVLRARTMAGRLCQSSCGGSLSSTRGGFFIRSGDSRTPLRGITLVMGRVFFPGYRYTDRAATKRRQSLETKTQAHRTKEIRQPSDGMRRGRLIDREIQQYVREIHEGVENGPAAAGETGPRRHKYTERMIAAMTQLQLTPVATQTVVGDISTGFATAVDIVCINARNEMCIIEQKAGFEGYNHIGNGRMLHEFSGVSNAPMNQHQLQLALTTWLFFKTFGVQIKHAYIIQIVENGVFYHKLQDQFLRQAPVALRRMNREIGTAADAKLNEQDMRPRGGGP